MIKFGIVDQIIKFHIKDFTQSFLHCEIIYFVPLNRNQKSENLWFKKEKSTLI